MIVVFDGYLIIIILLVIIGFFYELSSHVTGILLTLAFIVDFICGIAFIIFSIWEARDKEDWLFGLCGVFQGIIISLVFPLVYSLFGIAAGRHGSKVYFKDAEFILFGRFEKLDINLASLMVGVVIAIGYFILRFVTNRMMKYDGLLRYAGVIICIISVLLIPLIGLKIALKDAMNNTHDYFTWNGHDGEIIEKTQILNSFSGVYLPTGTFEAGTLVYTEVFKYVHLNKDHYDTKINDDEYLYVTDGKSVGFVKKSDVKNSVTRYTYMLPKGTEVHDFSTSYIEYKGLSEKFIYHDLASSVKMICDTDMYVDIIEDTGNGYFILLEDGTEGAVKKSCIVEIKNY